MTLEDDCYSEAQEFMKGNRSLVLKQDNFKGCYRELSENLSMDGDYWNRLRQAMKIWTQLF